MNIQLRPGQVIAAGCALAFLSAAVNACFLVQLGTSVGHLTGDVSKVAMHAAAENVAGTGGAEYLIAAAVGFVMGAGTAGFWIHHPGLALHRPYGRSVAAIGLILIGAHFAMRSAPVVSAGLAAFACGLQNALATHYRGTVLRTTHVTGLLTDLGTNLGMKLRGHDIAPWKLLVPGALVLSFFAGALAGTLLASHTPEVALLIPAGIYVAAGLLWSVYKHAWLLKGPKAESPDA